MLSRFEGTRIATLMLLANLFLLVWDYDRLKYVLPLYRPGEDRHVVDDQQVPSFCFSGVFSRRPCSVIVYQ